MEVLSPKGNYHVKSHKRYEKWMCKMRWTVSLQCRGVPVMVDSAIVFSVSYFRAILHKILALRFFLSLCSFSGQSLRYSACPPWGLDWPWVPGFLTSTSQVWDYRCAHEHSAWWRVLNKSWSSHIRAITLFAEWALSLYAMMITQHQTQAKWLHANDLIGILDYCVPGYLLKA